MKQINYELKLHSVCFILKTFEKTKVVEEKMNTGKNRFIYIDISFSLFNKKRYSKTQYFSWKMYSIMTY